MNTQEIFDLAKSKGAFYKGIFFVDNEPFCIHFFNRDMQELMYYHPDIMLPHVFENPREWSSDFVKSVKLSNI